jgi:hypothetical protein
VQTVTSGLDAGWSLCGQTGSQRSQCPQSWGFMCELVEPGLGGSADGDRRCSATVDGCSNHGGVRPCASPASSVHLSPADYDWVDTGTAVSFSAFQPGTIATPPVGETSRCAWMSWQVEGGWDDMACDTEMGYVCEAPMSSTGKECTTTPTPPAMPNSGKATAACGLETFNARMDDVSRTCCSTSEAECAGGTPTECSPACASKWIPFMSDCGSFVATTGLAEAFSAFSTRCTSASLASTSAGCTFATVMPILGTCLALDQEDFCTGTCYAQTESFLSQCQDSGGLLATYIPQLRALLDQCPPPPPPPPPAPPAPAGPGSAIDTCDIDALNAVCNGFSVGSLDDLCTSQCIRLVLLFYPVCSTTPGHEQFVAEVQPYITQCGGGLAPPPPPSPPPPSTDGAGDYSTCDIDHMNSLCNGFTISSADELCQTECIQEILHYYPVCSQTAGHEDFIASVQPYIVQCSGTSTETCDVAALNAACMDFAAPAGADLDILCAEPCIANIVDNFEACAVVPELTQFVNTMREVVIPCRSKGQERMCWNLLDEFHHNAAGCCAEDGCDEMPTSCSSECAEFFMPYFSSCAPFLFDGDMAQRMESFNRICAESVGRTNVYSSAAVDACAPLSCSECSGHCGWCASRGGVCSSECTTSPGECDAHNFEGADGSQGADDVDECAAQTSCGMCVTGHTPCAWCEAGGAHVCSGQCPADSTILPYHSTAEECATVPMPPHQRVFHPIEVGARSTMKEIAAGATVYMKFTARAGTTYEVVVRRVSIASFTLHLFDTDFSNSIATTALTASSGSPEGVLTWTCTVDGDYGLALRAGSVTDAGNAAISVSDSADACSAALGADDIPGVTFAGRDSGTIHFSAATGSDAAVSQHCRWNIQCSTGGHQSTHSVVSLDVSQLNTDLNRDVIEINNADSHFGSLQRITRMSGQLPPSHHPVLSRGEQMVVTFTSDRRDQGDEGFTASYHCVGGASARQYTVVVVGAGFVQGAITAKNPQAWFQFDAIPDTSYQIVTEGHTLLSTQIFVYAEDGVTQLQHATGAIEYTAAAGDPQTLRVMVSAGDSSQTGTFQIQIIEGVNACVAPRRIDATTSGPGTIALSSTDPATTPDSTCTWRISCHSIARISVTQFSAGDDDFLDIYGDDPDTQGHYASADLLGHLTGTLHTPRQFISPIGNPIIVELHSDSTDSKNFNIDYSCCLPTDGHGGLRCTGRDGTTITHGPPPPPRPSGGHPARPPPSPPPPPEHDWQRIEWPLSGSQVEQDAVLSRDSTRGYYEFAGGRGTQYTIEASTGDLRSATLVLFDADGTTQLDSLQVTASTESGAQASNSITWSCLSNAHYRLLVTGALGSASSGTLSITITGQDNDGGACRDASASSGPGAELGLQNGQHHLLNFGSDSAGEICDWQFECDEAGGAPGNYLTVDITRLALSNGAFLQAFMGEHPIRLGHSQRLAQTLDEGDAPVRVRAASGSLRLQLNAADGSAYRGISATYFCSQDAQPAETPASSVSPPPPSLADQCATLTETFHSACCDDGLPFTTCFRGAPSCSQTCASHFLPFQQQCQAYISRLHLDFLTPFRHLSDLCPLSVPPPPPGPPPPPPPPPPADVSGLTPVTFQVDFSQAPDMLALVSGGTVHNSVTINGDFNSWCGPKEGDDPNSCDNYMQPRWADASHLANEAIFSITKLLPPGTYKYLYSMDGFSGQIESLPASCADHPWRDDIGVLHSARTVTVADAPITARSVWAECGTEDVAPSPPPPQVFPPPSPPAAATCLCRDAWESAGVHYQGCAESPLGNWCVVKDMCNGAHSTGDGTSWVQCTDDNVAPPPPPGVPPPPPPPPPPPRAVGLPGIDGKEVASPIVTQVSTADAGEGVAGHTTYRLSLLLNPAQTTNIYTIFVSNHDCTYIRSRSFQCMW